ncbi:hypothetical protein HOY34_11330 [Xinfangfangia sp. D13-10-4-6]|uniref:hypothetical protein n=1 Tax=Pseudogemmobacter hezensis TaxID=2737662 RepID=UPI001552FD92|nr:hypothetical protein [Pseudogemmobacter hezensis]NPD15793.1 hypothetical protein [Pseudogemmobacter hezensis]
MTDPTHGLVGLVQSGWTQFMAIAGVIWWARKIDLRGQASVERLDRHEARLTAFEQTQQSQAIQLARIEETLSAMKLTLDRIYTEMREKG